MGASILLAVALRCSQPADQTSVREKYAEAPEAGARRNGTLREERRSARRREIRGCAAARLWGFASENADNPMGGNAAREASGCC
jgi:hypothetical protein